MHKPQDSADEVERQSADLAESFKGDNQQAFNRLVQLHQRWVFNVCFRLLGDYDDADDCAQDVFLKVHRALTGFRFESNFRTWLYRIAVNTCKNRLNSLEYRLRARRVRLDLMQDAGRDLPSPEMEDRASSLEVALARERIDRLIQAAINTLPTRQRLVVVLRDIEGRSYEEIVELTGFKLGTVKSKLSRARQQLREALEGKI